MIPMPIPISAFYSLSIPTLRILILIPDNNSFFWYLSVSGFGENTSLESGQVKPGKVKSGKFKSDQVKLGQVK